MKSIIFGCDGQDGSYLSRLLYKHDINVVGVSNLNSEWTKGDVGDYKFVDEIIRATNPDYIFHFAAISTTRHEVLFDNHNAISNGTLNILESVKNHCPHSRVFLSGSAMQFQNDGRPIDEHTPFEASSPYSMSRIHSTYAGRYYRHAFGVKIYVGYFFNHDSPLRTESHVNKKITASALRIAKGSTERLELGNVDVRKEFNFAGDIVEAVWTMINQDAVYEAVIGSGKSYSIREWTAYCFSKIGRNWEDHVTVLRDYTPEYSTLVSNPALIKSIGWEPRVDFYQLADMMMAEA